MRAVDEEQRLGASRREMLNAEKVRAVWRRLWDCEVDLFLVVRFPIPIFFLLIVIGRDTGNLEPVPLCAVKSL